jgi:hypothetical protein
LINLELVADQVCKGPVIGEIVVRKLFNNEIVRVIASNLELKEALKEKKLPKTRRMMVDIAGTKFKAPVIMHLPQDLDET